ncbi:vomeronasal 1 receptor ornAnaV1R3136 [Ornithorhynchus anatinus]|uniref:Vomeronasal type-1 receptor n=1 Tax=Ornithorhynchus anatinus TaxID=9258 RepID=F6TLF8_ORNAN|nr:vomeronasal 1 receptor ornAnaV1R3136 [Ornithorhynchus anatinus]
MDASELPYGILFLLQIVFGFSGNLFLLLVYMYVVSITHKLNPPDLIVAHLALANTMALLSWVIPDILSAWGLNNFLNDVSCKIILYINRVARGLAICMTCLLSVFQAVTISPGTSQWEGIKTQFPKCTLPSCLFSCILNLLSDMTAPVFITGLRNSTNMNSVILKYCSSISISAGTNLFNTVVLSLRDTFFLGLISVASGYLHGPGCSPKAVPEVRAAKRVIALVTLYILLYGQNTITLSFLLNMRINSSLILNSNNFMSFIFSASSPILMILSDRGLRMFWKRDSHIPNWNPA